MVPKRDLLLAGLEDVTKLTPTALDVMVLSASMGGGHLTAAESVAHAFRKCHPNSEVIIRDYFSYLSAFERGTVEWPYWFWLKWYPRGYRMWYAWTNRRTFSKTIKKSFRTLGYSRMLQDVGQHNPKIMVHTFPMSVALAEKIRRKQDHHYLNVVIVTDFQAHRNWVNLDADLYLVATLEVKKQLVDWGVQAQKVHVTGIPVPDKFTHLASKKIIRKNLGLNADLPTILVSAGALGMYRGYHDIFNSLKQLKQPVQVITVNGPEQFHELRKVEGLVLKSYGFSSRFAELLAASDILVGKAGGLTMAEACAVGTPSVIFEPIPGQEEGNARYLSEQGAAIWARDARGLTEALNKLLQEPETRERMGEKARSLGKPQAAEHAAKIILQKWSQHAD